MCYIFMYFYSDFWVTLKASNSGILVSKSQNNSDLLTEKSEISELFWLIKKSQNNSDFLVGLKLFLSIYILLNFKSMHFGMFFIKSNQQRKTHFLYIFS